MGRPRKRWNHTVGEHGCTVRVEERAPGSTLRLRWWNPVREKHEYQALGHRDRERAVEEATKLANMRYAQRTGRATLGQLVGLYLRHNATKNSNRWEAEMYRRGELVLRVFGPDRSPGDITDLEIDTFITNRRTGTIDGRGKRVPKDQRRTVRPGTVGHDIKFLKAVTAWAARRRIGDNQYLLDKDPLRGVQVPTTKNPRRPTTTEERYQQTLTVAAEVSPHLPLLLQIVHETGQRVGAVRRLKYSDLHLDDGTYGKIRWRGEHQKNSKLAVLPISRAARKALHAHVKEYPGVGEAWLFPHPEGGDRPASRFVTDRWLRDAEALAGLEPLDGSLWHAYKRKWMTERSQFSAAERARLANMVTPGLVAQIYEQPEDKRLEEVAENRRVLHEAQR